MMNMGDVDVLGKMGELKEIVAKVSAQFKDPVSAYSSLTKDVLIVWCRI